MSPALLPLIAAPFIGSFLGVLIRRLPQEIPVALDRSRCESCGAPLRPIELIPILSYLIQRGRCRRCGARISPGHLWVELTAILVPLCAGYFDVAAPWLWADCVLGWTLLALGWIDWEHLILPDALTLPLLLAGLGATVWLDGTAVTDHAIAAAAGYAGSRAVSLAYRRFRGREGLGAGDAKLLAASGAWVGLGGLGPVLVIASLAGLAAAVIRDRSLRPTTVVPLGTCLALATWLVRLALT